MKKTPPDDERITEPTTLLWRIDPANAPNWYTGQIVIGGKLHKIDVHLPNEENGERKCRFKLRRIGRAKKAGKP